MWQMLARLVAGGVARAEGAEAAAGAMGAAESAATGAMVKKKLSDAMTPANDDTKAAARNDPHAVAQPSPSYGLVNNIPQFGATATGPTHVNDNAPMVSAGSSMFDSSQVINLLTTSVALLRNIVNGIEQQAQMAKDSAKALRESQLERADKAGAITSEAQDGVAGNPDEGIGKALATLGIGAAGIWGLKKLDGLATKSADQLTDYFSDALSKFLGSFIEELPDTMAKFIMGTIGGGPVKGMFDALKPESGGGRHSPGVAPDSKPVEGAKGDRARRMKVLYNTFRKQGLTHEGSMTMLAQIGRENSYQESLMFGTHYDPHNKKRNAGIISWQGTRADALMSFMRKRGQLDEKGNIRKTDEALAAQAEFMVQEMRTSKKYRESYDAVTDPTKKYKDIEGVVGDNYIAWRRNDPRYRADGYRNQNYFLKQAQGVIAKDTVPEYTKPAPPLLQRRDQAPKPAAGSPLLRPGAKPVEFNPWAPKPVARSSFTAEQPAFGSMFGPLNVNPIESTRNQIERQTDPSGLLERILGAGNFSGARIQAPKLGQIDNVMMSVLRDIVESQRQPTSEPSVAPTVTMPVITQGGSSQTPSAMSLNVPSPGKPLSTMSWDMYFDTQRGL